MGIPFYPYTSCKEGSFKAGVSMSEFMDLADNGDIEVSYRGGKILLVNNDTLNRYIAKNGGRKEKYRKYLSAEINAVQRKMISQYARMAKIGFSNSVSANGFNQNKILQFYNIITEMKKYEKTLYQLLELGFTAKTLDKYFCKNLHKNSSKPIVLIEKIGNVTYTLQSYHLFFKMYKSTLMKYKNIKFIKLSQIRPIVFKARRKFDY